MGLVRAEIELVNAPDISFAEAGVIDESAIRKMKVTALVDSGSVMMAINETVKG
ncbi:MAG: hypothetical protein JNK66_09295 [Chitinophagales bacterium]|nr:hypothetical protein [Chitinophagales bacterium]